MIERKQMIDTKAIESNIREILKKELKLKKPAEKVGFKESLKNLGVDSVTFIVMLVAIENKFGLEFDEGSLDAVSDPTIENLVIAVSDNLIKK